MTVASMVTSMVRRTMPHRLTWQVVSMMVPTLAHAMTGIWACRTGLARGYNQAGGMLMTGLPSKSDPG